ncbi:type I-B CRISPR-associated protein Cas7/Csh2 [Campylobacter sp.]|uniref:type I-B CRISPR-associated protein Cas7/Csh2 n=1 Tax=Campylobacter sp. TaxID=205 RepID=UPI0026FD89CB|nr:type I-B CRISPR-associated protein Cas7/Csh2 [Campylobacter sp.]
MNKKEILFLWDGENFNPNGDMLRENAPRMDDETGVAEVTDVRIKRTIRDEIMKKDQSLIFIKEYKKDENVLDCKSAIREVGINIKQEKQEIEKEILSRFIDIRAFGGVLPISDKDEMKKDKDIKTAGVQFTGPVQFRMSRSLHRVCMQHIKGTGAFASGSDKGNKTFREEDFISYAIFATYGIIDNNNAKNTNFTQSDADEILQALWNGTKNLITRSKAGQMPRFMLIVTYKDNTFAGDLNNSISIKSDKDDEAIRNINDFTVDFTKLKSKLSRYAGSIEKIEYMSDYDFEQNNRSQFDSSWVKIGI